MCQDRAIVEHPQTIQMADGGEAVAFAYQIGLAPIFGDVDYERQPQICGRGPDLHKQLCRAVVWRVCAEIESAQFVSGMLNHRLARFLKRNWPIGSSCGP